MQAPAELMGRYACHCRSGEVSTNGVIDVFRVLRTSTFSDRHAPKELLYKRAENYKDI